MLRSLLTVCLVALAQPAQAEGPACEVAALIGSAQVGDQALRVGSKIAAGSELRTGADSRLRLRCADGSSLVLAANSRLRIDSFELKDGRRVDARLSLSLGLIGQKVSGGGGWSVRTPTAVTAVRGTEYLIEVKEDQSTAVLMQSGQVDVRPAGPRTRSLAAALPLVALVGALGTDCSQGQCSAAGPWSAERVRALQERLAGI